MVYHHPVIGNYHVLAQGICYSSHSCRLLHVQNGYCRFEEAERTYNQAMQLVKRLQVAGASPNLASLYSEFSTLYMLRSNYAEVSGFSL